MDKGELEHQRADDETRDEVNILILDYMLCMAIHEATSGKVQSWASWLEDTQRILELMLPQIETLTPDLRIKMQVFDTISIFTRTALAQSTTLANLATRLVASSRATNQKATKAHALEAAMQICAHAATRVHHDPSDGPFTSRSIESREEGTQGDKQGTADSLARTLSLLDISTKRHLETTEQLMRDKGTTTRLFDSLINIMMSLETPVLIQLERGKLKGLSRAQTEELKARIGMY
ncbi:hypothetical protein BJX64DRAFT_292092 [Aspergillus heterothallicus]